MFRNVTGAQEAVVHRQSEDSLLHENNQIKLIKDVQSDAIAQTYPTLKTKWFHERQQLIENLKRLQKHHTVSHEIQHIQNLIECLNELIEHGEVTKNCQLLINGMNQNIQPLPETYVLTKKPLGDKMIRLPRHVSKTKINIANPFKKIPSKILHIQHSNEKLQSQIDSQVNVQETHVDETIDSDETTTSSISSGKMKNGIQFYVVAEPFRNQTDKKTRKNIVLHEP